MGHGRIKVLVGALALALLAAGCSGSLNPLAGTGSAGSSGDGGPAASAKLAAPEDVDIDLAGTVCLPPGPSAPCPNMYVADTANNRIRRIGNDDDLLATAVPNGVIDTILMGKVLGSSLKSPRGVAVGAPNVVAVSDSGNNRVLRLDVLGPATSLLAGGGAETGPCATQAKLRNPSGLAVDNGGNLFIADTGNNVIREVFGVMGPSPAPPCNPNTAVVGDPGTIAVVAGKLGSAGFKDLMPATAAKLNGPRDVEIDPSGAPTVFVADTGNNRVRIFPLGGNIETLAGRGSAGFNGDCGTASLAQLDHPSGLSFVPGSLGDLSIVNDHSLYVSDTGNNRIRRIDIPFFGGTPQVRTVATDYQVPINGPGSLPMSLKQPRGLVAGRTQDPPFGTVRDGIAVADTGNNMVGGIAFQEPFQECGLP